VKIVAAIDSFKGSATSQELNVATLSLIEADNKVAIPIADGGEGTLQAIHAALGGQWVTFQTVDLLLRPIEATVLVTGGKAFIESASVLGLDLITPSPQTVEKATSYGLGQLVNGVVKLGVNDIYITLGGTGTSDGGLGFIQALNEELPTANPLLHKATIIRPKSMKITGLSDVNNPYSGPQGFAHIFGPQKGATSEQVDELDKQSVNICQQILTDYQLDLNAIEGAGAAGGLGAAIVLAGGQLQPGFETISKLIDFKHHIEDADLIFTGEGRFDSQTNGGKVPVGVAKIAAKYGVPVVVLTGGLQQGVRQTDFLGIFSIQSGPTSIEAAMSKDTTLANIARTAQQVFQVFSHKTSKLTQK
jgi:glycerate kinase